MSSRLTLTIRIMLSAMLTATQEGSSVQQARLRRLPPALHHMRCSSLQHAVNSRATKHTQTVFEPTQARQIGPPAAGDVPHHEHTLMSACRDADADAACQTMNWMTDAASATENSPVPTKLYCIPVNRKASFAEKARQHSASACQCIVVCDTPEESAATCSAPYTVC